VCLHGVALVRGDWCCEIGRVAFVRPRLAEKACAGGNVRVVEIYLIIRSWGYGVCQHSPRWGGRSSASGKRERSDSRREGAQIARRVDSVNKGSACAREGRGR
jgi:hypothetical protein